MVYNRGSSARGTKDYIFNRSPGGSLEKFVNVYAGTALLRVSLIPLFWGKLEVVDMLKRRGI